jgi:phosphotransferase system  glucose/maltose/N-acetylglucosamine-specific IIC component
MRRFAVECWDFFGTAALCFGVTGFIPLDSMGNLMMPGWVAFALIVVAVFSELLFDAFIDRSNENTPRPSLGSKWAEV